MKANKILTALTALLIIFSLNACENKPTVNNMPSETDIISEENSAVRLKNFMTENEKSKVSIGELTLLDEDNISGVELTIQTKEDLIRFFEENKDNKELFLTDEEYNSELEKIKSADDEDLKAIHNVAVDGRIYRGGFYPPLNYDGGYLTYYISYMSDKNTVEFDNFEDFKKWYREKYLDRNVTDGFYSQEQSDRIFEDMQTLFQSVIDGTYKTVGTDEFDSKYSAQFKNTWEFNRDEVEAIRDSVREISIYDEELDMDFLVHVTLPPDFDESETYPMFVFSDGVWRFGNCPSLWNMMKSDEIQDIILVTIGYSYQHDGTSVNERARFFYEERDKFVDFVTDNLAPYLSENYNIDFEHSGLYGHSAGGVMSHYAVFNSDLYENQPFRYYIIGSPAFWALHRLGSEENPDAYKNEYGYFERNNNFDKILYICGGENEDPVYKEYYDGYDSTLEGIANLTARLDSYGIDSYRCKIYENTGHWEFIPDMFREFFLEFYSR